MTTSDEKEQCFERRKKHLKISLTPDLEKAIDELQAANKGRLKSEILRDLIALGIGAAIKDAIAKDKNKR